MLIQHILTPEIFLTVFGNTEFHRENNIAKELEAVVHTFFRGSVKMDLHKRLEAYYGAIRTAAAGIADHHEKQKFLKALYENFYRAYNPAGADRLGIFYTPNEIVRFMVESADYLCEKHFGKFLADKDVQILDPAAGTGTFITELIDYIPKSKLRYKYENEIHSNEVAILPYYVANLNIELTYYQKMGEYAEFPHICFVDTLDNLGYEGRKGMDDLFAVSDENIERIKQQNKAKMMVIIGNPPYRANQANENDNNKNREYPGVDRRIKDTYLKWSDAQKTKLYDMYTRFVRWASDRIVDQGIVAFIMNRSFIDASGFDGFRKVVADEFSHIYVVDLGGDVRANPKLSGPKHNVFAIQTGVAIAFLVKKASHKGQAQIFYTRRPEMETAIEKLSGFAEYF
jgi:predicted helicase